jgi:hypothetical protein
VTNTATQHRSNVAGYGDGECPELAFWGPNPAQARIFKASRKMFQSLGTEYGWIWMNMVEITFLKLPFRGGRYCLTFHHYSPHHQTREHLFPSRKRHKPRTHLGPDFNVGRCWQVFRPEMEQWKSLAIGASRFSIQPKHCLRLTAVYTWPAFSSRKTL